MTSRDGGRFGLLGGTFDPPHAAHRALAEAARESLQLDRVVFVPAGDPWRKADRAVTRAAARLEMTRALVEGVPWAEVSTIEIDRQGPSFTADTIEALATVRGGMWWVILGADALGDLEHWRDPARIVAAARLGVAARPGALLEASEALRALVPGIGTRLDRVEMPEVNLSSTEVRSRLRSGEPVEGIVPSRVLDVVRRLGLYGPEAGDAPAD
ncbi:MAG: nicotinate (nicotinamide) nucleotide adenylyltransferase [Dehalococcoidia bacterium]|nr:MAG: nicotinate (nicotinamide) nucleotide adenylyltransferase [Dehalococcoidia bacterium]